MGCNWLFPPAPLSLTHSLLSEYCCLATYRGAGISRLCLLPLGPYTTPPACCTASGSAGISQGTLPSCGNRQGLIRTRVVAEALIHRTEHTAPVCSNLCQQALTLDCCCLM
ncbi:hypothetical protein ACOMHN_003976 [Nucella lapillus]